MLPSDGDKATVFLIPPRAISDTFLIETNKNIRDKQMLYVEFTNNKTEFETPLRFFPIKIRD